MSDQELQMNKKEIIVNVRKLAALDIAFHGARFILAEFAAGVILCGGFGAFSLFAFSHNPDHPFFVLILGLALLWVALNYVPLWLYAIDITRSNSARQEVAFELEHKERYALKYTLQSLWLLCPLVVPVLAISQEVKKSRS